jgi:hypothetical protein
MDVMQRWRPSMGHALKRSTGVGPLRVTSPGSRSGRPVS